MSFSFESLAGQPCAECGTACVAVADGFSMGVNCPNCGWGIATTNQEAIKISQRPIPCPMCNNKIVGRFVNCELVFNCENCDFETYTNGNPEIILDNNLYALKIPDFDLSNKKQVRLLSDIANQSYLELNQKKHLGEDLLFTFLAGETFYLSQLLDFVNLKYEIVPEFKYTVQNLFSTEETP